MQEAKYSAVKVEVKCANGKEIKKSASNTTSKITQPLLTDEDADIVIRSASHYY